MIVTGCGNQQACTTRHPFSINETMPANDTKGSALRPMTGGTYLVEQSRDSRRLQLQYPAASTINLKCNLQSATHHCGQCSRGSRLSQGLIRIGARHVPGGLNPAGFFISGPGFARAGGAAGTGQSDGGRERTAPGTKHAHGLDGRETGSDHVCSGRLHHVSRACISRSNQSARLFVTETMATH